MTTTPLPQPPILGIDVATQLASAGPGLADCVNALITSLTGQPESTMQLGHQLLWLAIEADRLEGNAYDGTKVDSLDDLIEDGLRAGLEPAPHSLDLTTVFLAVGAGGGMLIDVDELGDLDEPADLLRALCAVLVVRLHRLAIALDLCLPHALHELKQDLEL